MVPAPPGWVIRGRFGCQPAYVRAGSAGLGGAGHARSRPGTLSRPGPWAATGASSGQRADDRAPAGSEPRGASLLRLLACPVAVAAPALLVSEHLTAEHLALPVRRTSARRAAGHLGRLARGGSDMSALARPGEVLVRVVGGHARPRRQFQVVRDSGNSTNRLSQHARSRPRSEPAPRTDVPRRPRRKFLSFYLPQQKRASRSRSGSQSERRRIVLGGDGLEGRRAPTHAAIRWGLAGPAGSA